MRVIAGKYRSRNLQSLPGMETRPTYDRLKETLFNVLASAGQLEGKVFFDLFAGTGSIGIEALSRGAARVYFAESARKPAQLIRANLQSLGIVAEAELCECTAAEALHQWSDLGLAADVIFLDPPYKLEGAYRQVLRIVGDSNLLTQTGVVVAEHDRHFDPGDSEGKLTRFRKLQQGESALSFYRFSGRSGGV